MLSVGKYRVFDEWRVDGVQPNGYYDGVVDSDVLGYPVCLVFCDPNRVADAAERNVDAECNVVVYTECFLHADAA